MAGVRQNILTDANARDQFIEGARLLKAEQLGPTTAQLGIPGPALPVSTWDLFVVWHHTAMNRYTPPAQGDRNAAHRGPIFLPWHRFMLILLELQFQRVLSDPTFGLPYWDWAADGELSPTQQRSSPLWAANAMGTGQGTISTGAFALHPAQPGAWRVRIDVDVQGGLRSVDRGLRRAIGQGIGGLPRKLDVASALALRPYDMSPWSTTSQGFRNRLEGWQPVATAPGLHNRVHLWVGGDMLPSSSPNDPVFYLNHCNVDRIWAAYQAQPSSPPYVPGSSAPGALQGHRLDDQMYALLSNSVTPRQMLDPSRYYSYDTLDVT